MIGQHSQKVTQRQGKALEHMVMMDYDGVPYSKWGDLEYATVMHAAFYWRSY